MLDWLLWKRGSGIDRGFAGVGLSSGFEGGSILKSYWG
jgi:hypothetical protein